MSAGTPRTPGSAGTRSTGNAGMPGHSGNAETPRNSGSGCPRLHSPWETFLDGELPAPQMLELQTHLDVCTECAGEVTFSRAVRASMRKAVLGNDTAELGEAFQARLRGALQHEAQLEQRTQKSVHRRRLLQQWAPRAGALAISSAALWVLWLRMKDNVEPTTDVSGAVAAHKSGAAIESAMVEPEELLDRMIDYHSAPPEPQVTRPELVPQLERDVGVRIPVLNLSRYGALWQGASVVRVRQDRSAASFRFRTKDNHQVTLYVYNPSRIPLHATLEPRMFREEPVYEGYRRGYTIVAQTRRGVGYALTTDLDEPLSAELVQAISKSAVTH